MRIDEINSRIEDIEKRFFSNDERLIIQSSMDEVPLVAANVSNSTDSFTERQILYIYGGYWSMAETLKVVGRYRRKNRLIKGSIRIKNLTNFRPKIVYDPRVISKLQGEVITLSSILGCSAFDL
ncbi:hypothetical protein ACFOEK_06215 [Litoribrevibacter euphylliae]|uniref:Uncharacterized protein n=1 Tax=Litoribrevibacter euphylliae TaxID=1834034 RepID=A0ABV7HGE5_9GAMM